MLEQQGNALVFLAHYTTDGLSTTGLTVTVDVYEGDTEIVTGGSAVEVGDGLYRYTLASGSVDANALYTAVFKTATATVDAQHIPALWIVGRTWVNNVNATITSRSSHSAADVWASATRTLTSFGTLVADIWASATRTLTMTAQSILAAIADGEIAQQRGDQWNIALTALGNLASYTTLDFTVKADDRKADTAALLRVRLNLSGSSDGLLVLNGAAYGTDSDGAITISDAAAGDINVAVKPAATKLLKPGVYTYDVQLINTDGTVGTLSQGSFEVLADVTRAVS